MTALREAVAGDYGTALAFIARLVRDFDQLPLAAVSLQPNLTIEGLPVRAHGVVHSAAEVQAWASAFGEQVRVSPSGSVWHYGTSSVVAGIPLDIAAVVPAAAGIADLYAADHQDSTDTPLPPAGDAIPPGVRVGGPGTGGGQRPAVPHGDPAAGAPSPAVTP